MKFFICRFTQALCILYLAYTLSGCGPGEPGVWQNEKIKQSKREEFHKMNDQLFSGLKANRPQDIESLMSKEMLDNPYNKRIIELISNQSRLGSYTVFNEYYIVNKHSKGKESIKIINTGTDAYSLRTHDFNKEMYIALLIPKTTGDKWMITAIYYKYDYGWKLNDLDLQPYTINGKTAPELYRHAKQMAHKGYFIDAVCAMELSRKSSTPSPVWKYSEEKDMASFYGKMIDKVNDVYKFPLVINQLPTKPRVFNIANQTIPEGVFPDVYYLSNISIKDTAALHKESEQVKKVIGQVFPGIDQNKYILFSVFNEKPTGKKVAESWDITAKL